MLGLWITAAIWGLSFALAKKAVFNIHPFVLVTLRLGLAGLTLLLVSVFRKTRRPVNRELIFWAFKIGLLEFAGTYLFYTWSLKYLPSGVVGALTLTTPALVYVLGLLFGIEKSNLKAFGAIALSVIGGWLTLPTSVQSSLLHLRRIENYNDSHFGILLILTSNLFFAMGNLLLEKKKIPQGDSEFSTSLCLLWGALISALVVIATGVGTSPPVLDGTSVAVVIYLSVVATGLGFYLWNKGVQTSSATTAAVIGNFKAPFAIYWGYFLLSESLSAPLIFGTLLLLISIYLLTQDRSSSKE